MFQPILVLAAARFLLLHVCKQNIAFWDWENAISIFSKFSLHRNIRINLGHILLAI